MAFVRIYLQLRLIELVGADRFLHPQRRWADLHREIDVLKMDTRPTDHCNIGRCDRDRIYTVPLLYRLVRSVFHTMDNSLIEAAYLCCPNRSTCRDPDEGLWLHL